MNVNFNCVRELEGEDLFEGSDHLSRFSELMSCYSGYAFFNAGLCKAMYLSAWDEEHFMVMLDMLNSLTLDKSQDTREMEDNGKFMEEISEGRDKEMYRLAGCFLTGEPYEIPDDVDSETYHIMERCLRAAEIIDEVVDY